MKFSPRKWFFFFGFSQVNSELLDQIRSRGVGFEPVRISDDDDDDDDDGGDNNFNYYCFVVVIIFQTKTFWIGISTGLWNEYLTK